MSFWANFALALVQMVVFIYDIITIPIYFLIYKPWITTAAYKQVGSSVAFKLGAVPFWHLQTKLRRSNIFWPFSSLLISSRFIVFCPWPFKIKNRPVKRFETVMTVKSREIELVSSRLFKTRRARRDGQTVKRGSTAGACFKLMFYTSLISKISWDACVTCSTFFHSLLTPQCSNVR